MQAEPEIFRIQSANADSPNWVKKYPKQYWDFLASMGREDQDSPTLVGFNEALIKLAKRCESRDYLAYEVEWERLMSDWGRVLHREDPHPPHPSRLINDKIDFGWLDVRVSVEKELDHLYELRRYTRIAFTSSLFERMRRRGFGPEVLGGLPNHEARLICWLEATFGLKWEALEARPACTVPGPFAPCASGRPLWLVASEDDDSDANVAHDQLEAWGAEVVHSATALEAAQYASRGGVVGAIIHFDANREAEYVIADICMRQGIGFLVIADGDDPRPDDLGLGGAVMRSPTSMAEVRAAMKTLPAASLVGLDLSRVPRHPDSALCEAPSCDEDAGSAPPDQADDAPKKPV